MMEPNELLEHFNNGDTLGEDPEVIEMMRFYSRGQQRSCKHHRRRRSSKGHQTDRKRRGGT